MTDRYRGFVVVLDDAIREDEAEASIIPALQMIRGVTRVEPITRDITTETMAEMYVRHVVHDELVRFALTVLQPD